MKIFVYFGRAVKEIEKTIKMALKSRLNSKNKFIFAFTLS